MQQEASDCTIARASMPTQPSELHNQTAIADHHPKHQMLQCSECRTQHSGMHNQATLADNQPKSRTSRLSGSVTQHAGLQREAGLADRQHSCRTLQRSDLHGQAGSTNNQPGHRRLHQSGSEHNPAAATAPSLRGIRTSAACQVAMLNKEGCASAAGSLNRRSNPHTRQAASLQNTAHLKVEGLTEAFSNRKLQTSSAAEFSPPAHGDAADAHGCASDTIHDCSDTLSGGLDIFSGQSSLRSGAAEGRMVEAQVQQWQEGRTRAQRQAASTSGDWLTGESSCTPCYLPTLTLLTPAHASPPPPLHPHYPVF